MLRFWDSSAVLPLFAPEIGTADCQALARSDFAYWWGTPVEVAASLARRQREGSLTAIEAGTVRRVIEAHLLQGFEVAPSESIRTIAAVLLRLHPLRAADALQLAAALSVAGQKATNLEFVCLDKRLREAAILEGATVLP